MEPHTYQGRQGLVSDRQKAAEDMSVKTTDRCVHDRYPLGRYGKDLPVRPLSSPSLLLEGLDPDIAPKCLVGMAMEISTQLVSIARSDGCVCVAIS
jgi:hypothetical protein